jgi:hypothetical protein
MTAEEIYIVLALFTHMGNAEKPSLRPYFSQNQPVAMSIFGSVISLDRYESNCKFLHLIDNSKDIFEG